MRVAARSTLNSLISHLKTHSQDQSETLNKLSSGKRVNKASDDSASLSRAAKLKARTVSQRQAMRNSSDGLSFVQTAEGALAEITNVLTRLRELSIQSASDTVNTDERELIDKEYQGLKSEVDRIAEATSFNGTNIINGDDRGILEFHVGADSASENIIEFDTQESYADTSELGISSTSVDDKESALENVQALDGALDQISSRRSSLGAIQSRLHYANSSLETEIINHEQTRSQIEDADVAHEAAKLASKNLLTSTSVKALSQGIQSTKAITKLISS